MCSRLAIAPGAARSAAVTKEAVSLNARMNTSVTVLLVLLAAGCHRRVAPAPAPRRLVRLELPASLEPERQAYTSALEAARSHVVAWFDAQGLRLDDRELIDAAVVFADVADARRRLAKHFSVTEDQIPDGFSGTVDGKTLFLVPRAAYERTWARLYPEHPWSSGAYQQLMAHELAHRAHALEAVKRAGSEEGMGPRWFFEGLAITCAGQFAERPLPSLARAPFEALVTSDATQVLSYPLYGQMFTSVAERRPVRWLVEHAGRGDFAARLAAALPPAPAP